MVPAVSATPGEMLGDFYSCKEVTLSNLTLFFTNLLFGLQCCSVCKLPECFCLFAYLFVFYISELLGVFKWSETMPAAWGWAGIMGQCHSPHRCNGHVHEAPLQELGVAIRNHMSLG